MYGSLIVLLIQPCWNSVRFSCYCSRTDLTSCHYLSTGCLPSRRCLSWDAHCPLRPPDFCFCCVVCDFSETFCSILGVSKTFVLCMQSEVCIRNSADFRNGKEQIRQVSCFSLKTCYLNNYVNNLISRGGKLAVEPSSFPNSFSSFNVFSAFSVPWTAS